MGSFLSALCPSPRPAPPPYEDNFIDWTMVGQGEYGKVFRVTDQRTGETVAIKKIDLAMVNDYVEEECLNLAKCSHNNIVQFREVCKLLHHHLCTLRDSSA